MPASVSYVNLFFNVCIAIYMNSLVTMTLYLYYLMSFHTDDFFGFAKGCGFKGPKIRTFFAALIAHPILVALLLTWTTQSVESMVLSTEQIPTVVFILLAVIFSFLVWKPMVSAFKLNDPDSKCSNQLTYLHAVSAFFAALMVKTPKMSRTLIND
jgi:hypothetical protein